MGNRKAATEFFISTLTELDPDSANIEMYKKYFAELSDRAFDDLMSLIERGELVLPYFKPNMEKKPLKLETILKVCDKLKVKLFHRIWLTDSETGVRFLTPQEYLVMDVPIRRQKQHLVKGKSVAENIKYTDPLSGQVTGPSKTSRLSLPEIMILESSGHLKSIEEMMKVRGGDNVALREARRLVTEQGGYSLKHIEELGTRPTSVDTLRALLFGMHIENNL